MGARGYGNGIRAWLSNDLEAIVVAVIQPDFDSLHMCKLWPMLRPAHKSIYSNGAALYRSLYRAIAKVSYPAVNPKPLRLAAHRVTKKNTLYAAMNLEAQLLLWRSCHFDDKSGISYTPSAPVAKEKPSIDYKINNNNYSREHKLNLSCESGRIDNVQQIVFYKALCVAR